MADRADLLEKYGLEFDSALRNLVSDGDWVEFLKISSRFRNYSYQNLLLLVSQALDRGFTPTMVAGYRAWQKVGRQVKKGEKALCILAPRVRRTKCALTDESAEELETAIIGYRVVAVFDIVQTTGKEPPSVPEPFLLDVESEEMAFLLAMLAAFLRGRSYEVCFEPLREVNGFTDFANRVVKIRSDVSSGQCLKTLIHETAHVILHKDSKISRVQAEVEAESCAYVVCRALGLDSSGYSLPYVARWSNGDVSLVRTVAERVHGCAGQILDSLGR